MVLHFQLFGAIVGLIFSLFSWESPVGMDWIYIVLLGLFTQLGQVQLTMAFQSENAARVSIITYSGIIYALFYGWLLFGETHGWLEIGGMLLVIIGVILNLLNS